MTRSVVFWDFDGTLAYRDGGWTTCLHRVLLRNEVESLSIDALRPNLQTGFPWHSPELSHSQLFGALTWWEYLEGLLSRVLFNLGLSMEKAKLVASQIRQEYLDNSYWHDYQDSRNALETVADLGHSNYIISNHVPELSEIVDGVGLLDLVDGVFTSGLLGFEKPHPRIYLNALSLVGPTSSAFMIGDSLSADVTGANAAGLHGILVRKPNKTRYRYHSTDLLGAVAILVNLAPQSG